MPVADSPDPITKTISNLRNCIPRVDHDSPYEVTVFFGRILDVLSELNKKVEQLEKGNKTKIHETSAKINHSYICSLSPGNCLEMWMVYCCCTIDFFCCIVDRLDNGKNSYLILYV